MRFNSVGKSWSAGQRASVFNPSPATLLHFFNPTIPSPKQHAYCTHPDTIIQHRRTPSQLWPRRDYLDPLRHLNKGAHRSDSCYQGIGPPSNRMGISSDPQLTGLGANPRSSGGTSSKDRYWRDGVNRSKINEDHRWGEVVLPTLTGAYRVADWMTHGVDSFVSEGFLFTSMGSEQRIPQGLKLHCYRRPIRIPKD